MIVTPKQIEFFARAIVNRLEDRGLVEFGDAEAGIEIVSRVLSENFRYAESIEQEARERLSPEASSDELESEMRRIAAEKKFIL
jgi:hypothetical protein